MSAIFSFWSTIGSGGVGIWVGKETGTVVTCGGGVGGVLAVLVVAAWFWLLTQAVGCRRTTARGLENSYNIFRKDWIFFSKSE